MKDQELKNRLRMTMIDANAAEYGVNIHDLVFLDHGSLNGATIRRRDILEPVKDELSWMFSRTKPHTGTLSPGCLLCGKGSWSCLFINGKCNCRCFYCPTAQDDLSVPTTNRLTFSNAVDYCDYVSFFGFEGVSMSGGEPLLTPDKTIEFIENVRRNCGDHIHIWMYTNGTLLTSDLVRILKDAGLDEIRFDLSARDYDLEKLRLAVGHIPVVTVEIPAIPEDHDTLIHLIPAMYDSGVNHLNLHHMRLTPHNFRFLKNRNYTFLHGEKVTVLESELTALTILRLACEKGWKLPVNYCAFAYKNQHQRAANRRKSAPFVMKPHESITENGYIRNIILSGPEDRITAMGEVLSEKNPDRSLWQISGNRQQIQLHESLWAFVDTTGVELILNYYESILAQGLSYHNPFKEIRLVSGKKIYAEKQGRKAVKSVKPEEFENAVIRGNNKTGFYEFSPYEFISAGLQEYF